MGSSHYGLKPAAEVNMLGGAFLGSFDRGARGRPILEEIVPDPSGLDLGLKDDNVLEIYRALENHRVLVIVAPTGAGKSTVIPFRLIAPLELSGLRPDHFTSNGRQIVVTQPRRVAASDIPAVIAKKLYGTSVGPGSEIGYRHGLDREQTDPWNRLVFVTDGTLLNWLTDHRADKFSIVIVDEAHERSTQIDLILALMRSELVKHPHLRLIILSATIHANKFVEYFEKVLPGEVWARDFQECEKSFGYERIWWKGGVIERLAMSDAMASKIVQLLETTTEGGILGFMPGEKEILDTIRKISNRLDQSLQEGITLLPLFSTLPSKEIDKAKGPMRPVTRNGKRITPRRVVIATTIAETSITIPDVVHVVDSGLVKEPTWDTLTRTEGLDTNWHSQAGCRQRWGRAGRNRAGFAHTLYTEEQFNSFQPFTQPAIARVALDDVLIKAKRAGISDLEAFEFLDAPKTEEMNRVVQTLSRRRLADADGDPTVIGSEVFDLYQRISRFVDDSASSAPRALDMASLLLLADRYGCLIEALTFLVLLPHVGHNLYHTQKGLLRFDASWPVERRDRSGRIHESLRAGCEDDLDFILKIVALCEGLSFGPRTLGGKVWSGEVAINIDVLDKALASRDAMLEAFVRDAKGRGIRRIDLTLVARLRAIIEQAWPDRRIAKRDEGGWVGEGNGEGAFVTHTLALDWRADTRGLIASYGRPVRLKEEDRSLPTASVVIRAASQTETVTSADQLPRLLREIRLGTDLVRTHAQLLADQVIPVDASWEEGDAQYGSQILHGVAGALRVSSWTSSETAMPIALLEPTTGTQKILKARQGDELTVTFVRRVIFPPTRGTSEFVCAMKDGQRVYVKAFDLNFWLAERVAADEYVGNEIILTYAGDDADGRPILSRLFKVERGWKATCSRERCKATIVAVGVSDRNELKLTVRIDDALDKAEKHQATFSMARPTPEIVRLVAGDAVYFSFRKEVRGQWTLSLDRSDDIQEETDDDTDDDDREQADNEGPRSIFFPLRKFGIRLDGGKLTIDRILEVADMYGAIRENPRTEQYVRRLFRITHSFDIDLNSIDTDASLARATELLKQAISIWHDAWAADRSSIRERVKSHQKVLPTAGLTSYCFVRIKGVLDGAWEIQELRYQTEDRAAKVQRQRDYLASSHEKHEAWVASQEANIAKLLDRAATHNSAIKQAQLRQYAAENRTQVTAAKSKRRAILLELRQMEQEVAPAIARLSALRSAGLPAKDLRA